MVGHTFLATLGKKRLRPGGVKGTNFLINNSNINKHSKILEVACNQGTSAINLLKQFKDIKITACDIDPEVLEKAVFNSNKNGVKERVEFLVADATNLPFSDNSFDIIINEAMLTMLPIAKKEKAVSEYFRVLKPGGLLLTHDVYLKTEDLKIQKEVIADLSRQLLLHTNPLTKDNWENLFIKEGFIIYKNLTGKMSLLNPIGLIKDEGFFDAIKLLKRGLSKPNKKRFKGMFNVFKKHKRNIGFIANISQKPL